MVPVVNNTVLFTSKFVGMIDLILSILTTKINTHTHPTKGHKKTLESGGYVYNLGCSNGIMGVSIYSNSLNCTHYMCAVLSISSILE